MLFALLKPQTTNLKLQTSNQIILSYKYCLTREDYRNYYIFVTWSSPDKKKKRLMHYAKQVGFSILIIAVLIYFDVFLINKRIGYMLIAYVFLTLLFSLASGRVRMDRAVDVFAEDPLNAAVFTETEINVSEEGISVKDEYNFIQSRWNAFVKKEETKDYYFLFRNSLDALIIPKRVLKSNEGKEFFEKILRANLPIDAEINALTRK